MLDVRWLDVFGATRAARGREACSRITKGSKSDCLTVHSPTRHSALALRSIKLVHTLVWALFAGCVLLIPILSYFDYLLAAASLVGVVLVEVIILLFNRLSCPLTNVAARYTDDRRANFDIYLPEWLARHNKSIFGLLYALGSLYLVARWATS